MRRREFLQGLSALAAIGPKLPKVIAAATPKVVVNYDILAATEFLEGMSQQITHTFIYGNADWDATQFIGLRLEAPDARP